MTNHVHLVGRLGTQVQERELPSGDALVAFHVVVPRVRPKTVTKVDALPCHVTSAALIRKIRGIQPGEVLEVEGALRRRFWRSSTGLGSAVEVHVTSIRAVT
jgi:single-strand DNA-binding protein